MLAPRSSVWPQQHIGRPSGGQGQHQEPGGGDLPELQGSAGAVQECCPHGSGGEAQPEGTRHHGEAGELPGASHDLH